MVKTLNTVSAIIQTEPSKLADGEHHIFVAGNDTTAKTEVTALLDQYGWRNIIDLGGISSARGMEMLLIIWVRLMGALGTPMFNFRIVN